MAMKKTFDNKDNIKVVGSKKKGECLPGFRYRVGSEIYTVTKAYVADNEQMREVKSEIGEMTNMLLSTLKKDLDPLFNVKTEIEILSPDERVIRQAQAQGVESEEIEDESA